MSKLWEGSIQLSKGELLRDDSHSTPTLNPHETDCSNKSAVGRWIESYNMLRSLLSPIYFRYKIKMMETKHDALTCQLQT